MKLSFYLIVAIVILVALNLVQCERSKNIELSLQSKVSKSEQARVMERAHHEAEIRKMGDTVKIMHANLTAYVDQSKKKEKKMSLTIAQMIKNERSSRPDTVKITKVDSVYGSYDSLVRFVKKSRDSVWMEANAIIELEQKQYLSLDSLYQAEKLASAKLLGEVQKLESDVDREQRSRLSFGFGGGYGAQLNSDVIRVGPQVSVGLYYSVFKIKARKR